MIFYLTFNDVPSGIFSSQVIDVVKFAREKVNPRVKLVAFISLRGFSGNRAKIRRELPDALVIPMIPGLRRWALNRWTLKLLCLRYRPSKIIGRSVLATCLALQSGVKTVVYDGRGAISAEWEEYDVASDAQLVQQIPALEQQAIDQAQDRIAVSAQLVRHWKERFHYRSAEHHIIPCTLNKVFEQMEITEERLLATRRELGLDREDVVLVYAGSLAGWQSVGLLQNFLTSVLHHSEKNKMLFLSEPDAPIRQLMQDFPGRVLCRRVSPQAVPNYLGAADYGLLIRENSVTNEVASPVKFAEYLAAGLKIVISEGIGDYTQLVRDKQLGALAAETTPADLKALDLSTRLAHRQLALELFTKQQFLADYEQLFAER